MLKGKVQKIIIVISILIIAACSFSLLFRDKILDLTRPSQSIVQRETVEQIRETHRPHKTNKTEPTHHPLPSHKLKAPEAGSFKLTASQLDQLKEKIILPQISNYPGKIQIYFEIIASDQSISYNNSQMYPASLAKLFLMGAIFEEVQAGSLAYDENLAALVTPMITYSDNKSFNDLLAILADRGRAKNPYKSLDEFCKKYAFKETVIHNYFILQPKEHEFLRNYLVDYNFWTSSRDVGHFFKLLAQGKLVSKEASDQMLDILSRQERLSKLPHLLPETAKVYNKTGEFNNFSHDAALISSPNCDYILVVMSELPLPEKTYPDPDDEGDGGDSVEVSPDIILANPADQIMQSLSLDIYNYLNKP